MKAFTKHAARQTNRNGAVLAIVLTTLLSFAGPRAQSQTAYQLAQEMRERAEQMREQQQRQAEQARENEQLHEQQERQAEAQRQQQFQPQQQPQQYTPGAPNSVSRSYVPAASPSSATVYTPHSAATFSPAAEGNGLTTTFRPSSNGTTVFTPHGASAASAVSSSTGPTTVNGRTVYTPHALVGASTVSSTNVTSSNQVPSATSSPTSISAMQAHSVYRPVSGTVTATRTSAGTPGTSANPNSTQNSTSVTARYPIGQPGTGNSSSGARGNCTGQTANDPGICISAPSPASNSVNTYASGSPSGYCVPGDGLGMTCAGNGQTSGSGAPSGTASNGPGLNAFNPARTNIPVNMPAIDAGSSSGTAPAIEAPEDAGQDEVSLAPAADQGSDPQSVASVPGNVNSDSSASPASAASTALGNPDDGPSEEQENSLDTVMQLVETSAQQIASGIDDLKNSGPATAIENFLSTEVEPSLSGAITDIGGVVISLEKGLLDPGVALGVKGIVDQANDPNKLLNGPERSQMCAVLPDTCQPAPPKN
jgi:hypothetical protein